MFVFYTINFSLCRGIIELPLLSQMILGKKRQPCASNHFLGASLWLNCLGKQFWLNTIPCLIRSRAFLVIDYFPTFSRS
mgnify:CR=1 FL=1